MVRRAAVPLVCLLLVSGIASADDTPAKLTVHIVQQPDSPDKLKQTIAAMHAAFGELSPPDSDDDYFPVDQGDAKEASPDGIFKLSGQGSPPLVMPAFDGPKGGDPQIAVGKQWVAVTAYNTIQFYQYGKTTPEPAGEYLTSNPLSTEDLFAVLIAPGSPANADRALKSMGVPVCDCDPDGVRQHVACPTTASSTSACTRQIYDLRIRYDEQGQRFYFLAHTRPDGKALSDSSLRRSFNFLAVSHDENPHHGFTYFWWNEVVDEGCGTAPGAPSCSAGSKYVPGQAADYPSFAIVEPYFIEADNVMKVKSQAGSSGYQIIHIIPLDRLRNPPPSKPTLETTTLWQSTGPGSLQPVQHLGPYLPGEKPWYLVRTDIQNSHRGLTLVWFDKDTFKLHSTFVETLSYRAMRTKDDNDKCNPAMPHTTQLLSFANMGTSVISAVMRDGNLWAVWQGCHRWQGETDATSSILISEVTANETASSQQNSAMIGEGSSGEAGGSAVGYGNPGVTVTENGDAAIVYTRSGANVFPEARYSLWRKGDDGPMQSAVLHRGNCAPQPDPKGGKPHSWNIDTAGIASDPFVKNVVWMAHDYGYDTSGQDCSASGSKRVRPHLEMAIGKVILPEPPPPPPPPPAFDRKACLQSCRDTSKACESDCQKGHDWCLLHPDQGGLTPKQCNQRFACPNVCATQLTQCNAKCE